MAGREMVMTGTATEGGVGFLGLLTLLFIALKLTGVIAWSWLWVLAPIWIPTAILLGIIACILGFVVICVLIFAIGAGTVFLASLIFSKES